MTSLAMVLSGVGVRVGALAANPQSLNGWLEAHDGYRCLSGDCNNLVLDAVSRLNASVQLVGEAAKPPLAQLRAGLDAGALAYLAHIPALTHFVLLTGYGEGEVLNVNDAFYNATSYVYGNISDILIYNISAMPAR
jgi:hypothetical protein